MRFSSTYFAISGLFSAVRGDLHQLIVGTYVSDNLYTLEFDDVKLSLDLIGNYSAKAASSWIALSHDKKNLYGTSFTTAPAFVSYSLGSATDIKYDATIQIGENCSASRAIFILASPSPPYAVYGAPFGGGYANCGAVISVDSYGALSSLIQNYTYSPTSGIHGMAFDSTNTHLYSADDTASKLWTHSIDPLTGELTYINDISGPITDAHLRHVTVHPSNKYLYTIFESPNELAQYSLDPLTKLPSFETSFSLLPPNATVADYWADEVALSYSNDYLWATTRAHSSSKKGYISAFKLASNGSIETQLFLTPTSASGGGANSVAPSSFSDQFVALTDNSQGFVEILSLDPGDGNVSVMARVDIPVGGCCANVVWYS